jgi:hypothetical protein
MQILVERRASVSSEQGQAALSMSLAGNPA